VTLSTQEQKEFLNRGFTRRNIGKIAAMVTAGARVAILTFRSKIRNCVGFRVDSAGLLMASSDPKSGTEAEFESRVDSPSRKKNKQVARTTEVSAPIGRG